jgi:aspartate 1-decarboxylase
MNGAIARLAQIGDPLIILSYGIVKEDQAQFFKPVIVFVDDKNRITKIH